jgi:hypothetical protein
MALPLLDNVVEAAVGGVDDDRADWMVFLEGDHLALDRRLIRATVLVVVFRWREQDLEQGFSDSLQTVRQAGPARLQEPSGKVREMRRKSGVS